MHTLMPSHSLHSRFYSTICYIQILLPRASFRNTSDTCVYLAEDSVQWQALSNKVSNINLIVAPCIIIESLQFINQRMHIISYKTLLNTLKHSDMFRSCQIIIRELFPLLKLYYNIHNSIRICKRGVVAAYHVVWECVVEQWQWQWLAVARCASYTMHT